MELKIQQPDRSLESRFILTKTFFLQTFGAIPSITWVNQLNITKVRAYIAANLSGQIQATHQHAEYNHSRKKVITTLTVWVLDNQCMIEVGENYCEIFHTQQNAAFAHTLVKELSKFKESTKKAEFEINIIVPSSYGLELKSMEVKKTRLDLDLYYEDDFKEIDEIIRKRLNTRKDKGIVLLHGLPGTGKTTYLRYLIGRIKKKVIFISPDAARDIVSPQLIDLLIDNPDSVLIIEDAEKIIKDRKTDDDSSVSNLLNISDGLLADFLNVQIICTFNNPLSSIDNALLRAGRLIAKYEFNKLSVEKSRRLSEHLGFQTSITEPMTLAEITSQHEKTFKPKQPFRVIGFQREAV